jgi:hypothetical protein
MLSRSHLTLQWMANFSQSRLTTQSQLQLASDFQGHQRRPCMFQMSAKKSLLFQACNMRAVSGIGKIWWNQQIGAFSAFHGIGASISFFIIAAPVG